MLQRCFKFILVFLFAASFNAKATHNRAGEITYIRIAPFETVIGGIVVPVFTYSITLTKYTDHGLTIADRCFDTIYFGDGLKAIAPRVNGSPSGPFSLCNDCGSLNGRPIGCGEMVIDEPGYKVKKNVYTIIHTYSGAGTYTIRSADPNRNADVHNMFVSVNQMFYVESVLIIDNFTGANSSPVFNFMPIDKACMRVCFEHNPGAFDPDGDSLSYEISTPRGIGGQTVPGYFDPETGPNGVFGIDPVTGTLKWCNPQLTREYNIAFIVKEWRKNTSNEYKMIGYVLRDMQIIVNNCPNNQPPVISPFEDICVEAGQLLQKEITVSDANNHNLVTIEGGGGAFSAPSPPATLSPTAGATFTQSGGSFNTTFRWQTTCNHVRNQVYATTFKAQDDGTVVGLPQEVKLVSFQTYNIKVVPPSIKNVTATPIGSSINVSWSLSTCNPSANKLVAYKIYRRNGCSDYVSDPCKLGVPADVGYELVGEVASAENSFVDSNKGEGLIVGQSYSYVVIAQYADGLQSFGSTQVCVELKRDVPVIINVDVLSTAENGSILIKWIKPLTTEGQLDTTIFAGPYRFELKHKTTSENNYITIFTSAEANLTNLSETFTHLNINTELEAHEYLIDFYSNDEKVGASSKATSIFLNASSAERKINLAWDYNTPWTNSSFIIFRKAPGETLFNAIDTTTTTTYTDGKGIVNNENYCYFVRSFGQYSDTLIPRPLVNNSQEVCITAIDQTPPPSPTLAIDANCPSGIVEVTWTDMTLTADDIASYELFYKPTVQHTYELVATVSATAPLLFRYDGLSSIAGCYAIRAIDINGNKGNLSPDFCIDNCPIFELPNIFSPNNDNINDFYTAIRVRQIDTIALSVTDRWGNLVYQTTDPYFRWDGISQASGKPVSEGTFFVVCEVYEPRLKGTVKRAIYGSLQVVR